MERKKLVTRLALGAVLIAAVVAFFAFGLEHDLSLHALKARQHALAGYQQSHPWLLAGVFFGIYVAVTALSVPGAALLTIAGGLLFGLIEGTLLVSFASAIGASGAFLASRFLFRNAVKNRFGKRLKAIDEGIEREGGFYLFTLRLVPLFPFFVINLVMGLTGLSVITFYWVSQVGMLAGTVVYVNAGTQLGQITSLSGVLSPTLIGSFVLLGVFPWIARWILRFFKRRRVYARWDKPRHFDRNVVVIGAGSAGLVSAYIAAAVKAKVTLVEKNSMGGDCLNTGCVPSKALIRSARQAAQTRNGAAFGVHVDAVRVDFPAVMQRVREVITQVAPHDSVERYSELGVDVRKGEAKITSPWTVEVDGEPIHTRAIVIATGARPFVPDLPGLDQVDYLTSDTLWQLQSAPKALVIMGGGPVGCELAQAFARLGVSVAQVEMAPRLLGREDEDVSTFVHERLHDDGVDVRTGHKAVRVESGEHGHALICEHDEKTVAIPFDHLLVAVGRQPRTEGFGLDALDIPAPRTVETNAYLQTLYPNIHACGDVAGPYQFTHVAAHQAWHASVNALFGHLWRFKVDYSVLPAVTFVDPEVARVGLNESEAREQDVDVDVTRYALDELDRALAESGTAGFVKVLTQPGKDRILGATVVGAHAGELIAEFTLAMRHKLGLNKILGTVHAYPTWAEANKNTAGAWKRDHAPQGALKWLQRYHQWRCR